MGLDLFWWMPVYSAVSYVDFILIIFVISILSGLYTFWHSPKQNYPPGPKGWPLIGNVQAFSQKPHVRLFNLKDLYGDVYSLKLGSQDVVVVCSLAGIQEGLHERGDRFADRPNCPIYHTLYNGDRQNGISTGDYTEKAYIKRGFIQACLDGHYSNEEVIEHKITVHIADVVRAFSEFDGDAFNPTDVLLLNCLRISLWLVYGNQFESGDNNLHEILNTFTVRSTVKGSWLTDMPMFHLLDSKRKKQVCQRTSLQTAFQTKLVDKHKDTYDPDVVRDMIDQLLIFVENNEDRGVLTAEDMTYLLLDITGSGFETIAVTMTWILAYMAVYQDVQVKVQDEIDSVIGKDKVAGLEDQASLPFTVATILEVERLASVCPFLLPHRVTEKSILQGYDIPADTWILFNVWSLHHDPRLWRNPMKFDPTRFLKNGLVTVPDQFLPYGLGPRCCVGESLAEAELFLFFTSVLQRFNIQPPEGADISLEGEFTTLLKPPPFSIQAIERPNSGS